MSNPVPELPVQPVVERKSPQLFDPQSRPAAQSESESQSPSPMHRLPTPLHPPSSPAQLLQDARHGVVDVASGQYIQNHPANAAEATAFGHVEEGAPVEEM